MRRSDPMLNTLGSPCSPPRPGRCFVFLGRAGVVMPLIELCQGKRNKLRLYGPLGSPVQNCTMGT